MQSRMADSSATLVGRDIHHELAGHTVLDTVSLTVTPSTCLGVIGPNGVGKSTLLKILAGLVVPLGGRVIVDPPQATVGYLRQEHAARGSETVRESISRRAGLTALAEELALAASALGSGEPADENRYVAALSHYESAFAGDFESQLIGTLNQVGLPAEIAGRRVAELSGGQEAKVALAAVVTSRFDITMLDEPTNDLDFEGLSRLEEMVTERTGGIVIVSHDRDFLDRTVTDVLELDEHSHSGRLFGGGWAGYLAERETARLHAEEAYGVYVHRREDLRHRAQRERQWATKGVMREKKQPRDGDKAQQDFRVNRTERLAARSRRTERALETLDIVDKPWEGWNLRFDITETARSGDVVVELNRARVERGAFTLGPLTLRVDWADRIALSGPNGSGKTTLVDTILGRIPLMDGQRRIGPSVVTGELIQDRRSMTSPRSVVEQFEVDTGLSTQEARSRLAKFGLGADTVTRNLPSLSPGERTRVQLAGFAARGVNFLVLDEPTNHLDLPAIEQLESALEGFGGTLLLVSHDRRLLERVRITRRFTLPTEAESDLGVPDNS